MTMKELLNKKDGCYNIMNEIEEMKEELEKIKAFIERADVPSYVISLYNIAAKSVELAYNVLKKNDLN